MVATENGAPSLRAVVLCVAHIDALEPVGW